MANNVTYLNDEMRQIAEGLDSLKKSLVNGEITDIMITGISAEGNIISFSSFGENILRLLGAMHFSTNHVNEIMQMGVEMRDIDDLDGDDDSE